MSSRTRRDGATRSSKAVLTLANVCRTGVITLAGALVAINLITITWIRFTVDTRKAFCAFAAVLVGIGSTLSAVLAWI